MKTLMVLFAVVAVSFVSLNANALLPSVTWTCWSGFAGPGTGTFGQSSGSQGEAVSSLINACMGGCSGPITCGNSNGQVTRVALPY
jgi:hypothetical protein